MYTFQGKSISAHLTRLAQHGNKPFSAMLNPDVEGVLGIRVPQLRALAKSIAADASWREYVANADTEYMESRMLHGMVIGYVSGISLESRFALIREWVPRINSWSVCDCACSTFKIKKSEREQWWQFIQPYFKSSATYEVRFAVVMALREFVDESHIGRVLHIAGSIQHPDYYVKMAVAWLVAECFVKMPQRTMSFLESQSLDTFTHGKAIQKICESLRISAEQKATVRRLKRKEGKK